MYVAAPVDDMDKGSEGQSGRGEEKSKTEVVVL